MGGCFLLNDYVAEFIDELEKEILRQTGGSGLHRLSRVEKGGRQLAPASMRQG